MTIKPTIRNTLKVLRLITCQYEFGVLVDWFNKMITQQDNVVLVRAQTSTTVVGVVCQAAFSFNLSRTAATIATSGWAALSTRSPWHYGRRSWP